MRTAVLEHDQRSTVAIMVEQTQRDYRHLRSALNYLIRLRAIIDADPEIKNKVNPGLLGDMDCLIEEAGRR